MITRLPGASHFPDRTSALRLVAVVAIRSTAAWSDRRYLDMSLLDDNPHAKELNQVA